MTNRRRNIDLSMKGLLVFMRTKPVQASFPTWWMIRLVIDNFLSDICSMLNSDWYMNIGIDEHLAKRRRIELDRNIGWQILMNN